MEVGSDGRNFRVFLVILLLQRSLGCQDSPVGIANSSIIPDSRFTASSHYDSNYVPKYARLNGTAKGWGPETKTDPNDYLQIDLGEVFVICAVATQGCSKCDEWTLQYNISTSIDNNQYTTYKDGNQDKLFTGNSDRNTVVKNVLDVPTLARYIRFIPITFLNWKVLRVEAYGLKRDLFSCRSVPVGIGNGKIPDSNMTSSSTYNSTTSPSKARLGYTAGSSWCAATSDSSPYLQINLGSPYIICGIATQGDHMTDQWIQSYQIKVSKDETTFKKYMENSLFRSFDGNFNSNTVVNNVLYDGTIGQYIRVRPTSHYGTTNCMRTELYGIQQTGGCTSMAVGLSYSSIIPDHRFTASTQYSGYNPSYARLVTSNRAWTSSAPSVVDWLQIDLGSVVYVCALATQGAGSYGNEWATRYKIRVSLDNVNWNYYQENNTDKVFIGNTDVSTVVKRNLLHPVRTKFIRFHPTAYNGYPSMRVEVYGISTACSSPIGLEDPGVIGNSRMNSTSHLDSTHTASHGRLYGSTSWCSSTSSNTEYIQINLGQVMTVTGIASQGDHTVDKWVKTYTISYSMDGNLWNTYKAGQNTNKVLQGNNNRSSIVVRWLSHPLTARHVRVTPQTWNNAICMRMELYGCNFATRPVISGLTNQILTAAANSSVDLVCIVQEPLIQYIKWYTGNTDITSQSTGLVSGVNGVKTSTLRINYTNANDVLNTYHCIRSASSAKVLCTKSYVCKAMYEVNSIDADGVKSAGVAVRLDYPSTMETPTVDNIQSTSVTVKWTKPVLRPSQAAITLYVLQYQNSSSTQTINVSPPAVSHVITGLAIYTNYSVKIRAVSRVGQGEWSQTKNFRTDSALPVVSPASVAATSLTSQIIRVTWQKPSSGVNGLLLGYRVSYSPVSGSATLIDINAGQTSYDITSLDKWTVYRITVKCYNDKGDGPSAEVVVRTLEDAPSDAPGQFSVNVLSSTSVRLSWILPPMNSRNGIIRGFEVYYKKTGSSAIARNILGNSTLTYIITGLGKYTTYTFKVLAYTKPNLKGPYSNEIEKTTEQDAPSVPTNLQTTEIAPQGSTGPQVKLTWVQPSSPNGIIQYYIVSYSYSQGSPAVYKTNVTGVLTVTLPVFGGMTYWFSVKAVTIKEGNQITKEVAVQVYAPSQAPGNFNAIVQSSTSVLLSWSLSPINSRNGIIRGFEVYYKKTGSSESATTVNNPGNNTLKHTITGLGKYTTYTFKVLAYTELNKKGPYSNSIDKRTMQDAPSAPTNFQTIEIAPNGSTGPHVKLTWDPPSSPNGIIQYYIVSYSYSQSLPAVYKTNVTGVFTVTLPVFGGKTYWFSVQAVTIKEGNRTTKEVVIQVYAPSQAPGNFDVAVLSSTSVRLFWSLQPINSRNGIIRGFEVYYKKTDGSESAITKDLPGNSTLVHTITGLGKYTTYTFKVLAYTEPNKKGPYSNSIDKTTEQDAPSVPTNLQTSEIAPNGSTGPRVKLTWDPPSSPNGIIQYYIVSHNKSRPSSALSVINVTDISGLLNVTLPVYGGVTYLFSVKAVTIKQGEQTTKIFNVKVYAPTTAPKAVTFVEHNATTFTVQWEPLNTNNGPVTIYELSKTLKQDSSRSKRALPVEPEKINATCCNATLYKLPPCSQYSISVRAYASAGPGPFSTKLNLLTSEPLPPGNLAITHVGKREVTLQWKEPPSLTKPVEEYKISFNGTNLYDVKVKIPDETATSKDRTTTISNLHPATRYTFQVSAETECGMGKKSKQKPVDTKIDAPPPPDVTFISNITASTNNVSLWKASSRNGPVRAYQVIVVKGIDVPSFDEAKLTDYDKAQEDKLHYYIAAEIRTNSGEIFPKIFTIGDEKVYNGYKNMKLQEGKTYNVTQRALTRDEKLEVFPGPTVLIAKGKVPLPEVGGELGNKGSNTGAIATASVVVILIIAVLLVVAIVIWKRRKRGENKRKNADDLDNALNLNDIPEETSRKVSPSPDSRTNLVDESPRGTNKQAGRSNGAAHSNDDTDLYGNADAIRHQPIPINKFAQYVNEKRTGDNSFHQEFKTLSNGQQFPWDKARLPNNKPKNRYANIITYDHSRVLLQESTDDSDYINASYIHGFDGTPRTYIASQGPIPSTVADFWLMVWQENVKTIVMLTNLVEAGRVKCHQYWPDSKEQHGPMTVTLHRSDVLADYVVRTLIVSKKGEEGKKQVQHYQYTSWPDKGVPQHATSVLGFRRKVRAQYASSGGGPLLVHCSAGVGRTGAFLAVDAMLERSKKDKTIDVFNYVQLMRNNRITMVQTDEQYAFVHYAVLEALTCGNTEVSALNLNIVLGKLSKPRPKDQMTGYEVEFKRLNYITPALITEDSSKTGRMEENMPRNRYPDIIPLDSARVFLSIEGQNYINASFANAYREKNAFIMTQAPMTNTINDFWHMIFQYKIGSVVMLNALQEGNETFPQYLQSQGSQSYGDINIEVTSRETKGQLVITKCKLIHPMEPQTPHKFIHVHHTQWPDQSIPESNQSVLDLVTTVQKSQQQCGNTPVLVQCSDGVGRSGTFSAVYSLLERVKAEQVIDVFQAIKVLRLGRPNAVKTAEQYRFCYAMVQTYLNSFDDYANFSEV